MQIACFAEPRLFKECGSFGVNRIARRFKNNLTFFFVQFLEIDVVPPSMAIVE